MTLQYSVDVRNAKLNAVEDEIGVSPVLKLFTGAPPANCAAADSGTCLATMNLPVNWMAAAAGGTKQMTGTWEDTLSDNTGTPGHFRIYSAGGTCHIQGTVTAPGGGGDMESVTMSIVAGQVSAVGSFQLTAGNA